MIKDIKHLQLCSGKRNFTTLIGPRYGKSDQFAKGKILFCNLPRLLKMSATWESYQRPLRQTKAYSQKEQWTKYPHLLVEYDS